MSVSSIWNSVVFAWLVATLTPAWWGLVSRPGCGAGSGVLVVLDRRGGAGAANVRVQPRTTDDEGASFVDVAVLAHAGDVARSTQGTVTLVRR